jgi:hypothetical protein
MIFIQIFQIQQCILSVIKYCSFPTGKYRDLISHLIENHTMDEIKCVQGRKQGRTIKIDDKKTLNTCPKKL